MNTLLSNFKNPPNECRGKPFWSLNGKLDEDELIRQINVMKKMGFGGFFIHSRTGLQTEYLGNEWFGFINDCILEAKKLQMEVWLYDEDRWPSGSAGGLVTMNPRFRQKSICMDILEKNDFDLLNYHLEYLASFAAKFDGEYLVDYYPISHKADIKEGYKALVYKVVEMQKDTFYNGYTYVDTLNREATESFISLTHEKYKEACGDHFGKEIIGIFTDEPHRGALFSGFSLYNEERHSMIPYTFKLFEVFSEKFGADLKENLPEIYFRKKDEKVSKFAWQYVECLQQMFIDNFAKPYQEWCKANKLIVTGHILHEDSLSIQTSLSGSMMRYYEYMDYPGVDVLTENNKNFWVVKQCNSVARQLGKKFILSELYGCTGWQFNFQSHKTVGDWQGALGINFRCHHLSWYTMAGEAKRDYPASILHQSTYWEDYGYVEDYFARMGYIMSQGESVCNVLVINPVESVWALVSMGWIEGFEPKDDIVKQLEKEYCDTFQTLTENKIDFDYADEDILSRHYKIEIIGGKPILYVGLARYESVVVSGLLNIRGSTVAILKEFVRLGGKVVFIGEIPQYVDCEKSSIDNGLLNNSVLMDFNDSNLRAELVEERIAVEILSDSGEQVKSCICTFRKIGEEYFLLIVNTDRLTDIGKVRLILDSLYNAEEWNLRNGKVENASFSEDCGKTIIHSTIYAGGERLFRITKQPVESKSMPYQKVDGIITLNGEMDYELSDENVCVLDIGYYSVNGGELSEQNEILKIDRKLREILGIAYRAGNMIQPWFNEKYNNQTESKVLCDLEIKLPFYVEIVPKSLVLAIENPQDFEIYLNDKPVCEDISDKWIDICFNKIQLDVTGLKTGENFITLKTGFKENMNIEALYLLGNFGVKVSGTDKTLIDLPRKLFIGDICTQGLPFYSGKLQYKTNIVNCKVKVRLSDCYGALVKVKSGNVQNIIAFSPYISEVMEIVEPLILELVLTRRNTFGPLHLNPVNSEWYGPYEFILENERFSMEYKLIENGILLPPEVEILN